jgi:beta-lactamase superfamily II metal-dependent hydrolase
MFDGIEVDMLSLGDADAIIVTKYERGKPHRILIDGGKPSSAEVVLDFMLRRNATEYWAAICTHTHNDHARGLMKIVQDKRINIANGHLNDIRYYTAAYK